MQAKPHHPRPTGLIQQCTDELLDRVQDQGHLDGCEDFAFLLPAYVLSDFLGVHKEDRAKVVQWSVDFIDFFNVLPITVETSQRLTRSGFATTRRPCLRNGASIRGTIFLARWSTPRRKREVSQTMRLSPMRCSSCWPGM